MLGFGEGEGREIEKREEWQSVGLLFSFCAYVFLYFGFYRVSEKFLFYFFYIVLTWKIVGVSKASVIYIYIYRERLDSDESCVHV